MKKKSINTINYTLQLRPETGIDKKKRLVWARPVLTGTVDNSDIAQELSRSTTLTPTDVEAVLTGLGEKLMEHLRHGELVRLNGIGSFSVRIKSEQGADKKGHFRMEDLHVSGILFRPSKEFLSKVQDVDFNLTPGPSVEMPSDEEISLKLDEHFARIPTITSTDIMQMFGISRHRSLNIIAKLVERGTLVRNGRGSSTHYVKAANP